MNLTFEIARLITQLVGALMVARLAVNWALDRYKKEKIWEKRLGSYADVVAALGEMLRLNREWRRASLSNTDDETQNDRSLRFKEAKLKLNEVSAVGRLILPSRAQLILTELEDDLNATPRFDTRADALDWQREILYNTLDRLIELGRENLGSGLID